MQSNTSSYADAFHLFIYLAAQLNLMRTGDSGVDDKFGFWTHAYKTFNSRWDEMATPLVRLALFLHPAYRVLAKKPDEFTVLLKEVRKVLQQEWVSCVLQYWWSCQPLQFNAFLPYMLHFN